MTVVFPKSNDPDFYVTKTREIPEGMTARVIGARMEIIGDSVELQLRVSRGFNPRMPIASTRDIPTDMLAEIMKWINGHYE